MRKTILKRTSAGVAAILLALCAGLAALRGTAARSAQEAAGEGAQLFQEESCIQCHDPEGTGTQIGPGLRGLFDRERLPVSGRPLTEENVRRQLRDPYDQMPSFAEKLTDEQVDQLIAYLRTL